jgi:hypothetical protein
MNVPKRMNGGGPGVRRRTSLAQVPVSRITGNLGTGTVNREKEHNQILTGRLNAKPIIHGLPESLLAAQIFFRRLH